MRTRTVVVVVTTTGLALLALVQLGRPGASPSGAPRADRQPAQPGTWSPSPSLPELPPEGEETDEDAAALMAMVSAIDPVDGKLASVERLRRTLALYEEASVYPPWSRPAAEGSAPHLLQPNAPASMGQPFAADSEGRQIRTDLVLDRWFVGPGETATATLTVTREDQPGATYVPSVAVMRVEYYDPERKEWPVAGELSVVRRDNQLVAVIDPSAIPLLAAADPPPEVRLLAHVEVGAFFKDLPINFRYASRPSFKVLGSAGDRVADGSLEVDLEVEVHHIAPTLVQGVLYDAAGTRPIATHERQFQPSRTGRQIVTLQFFGKALHEAGVNGRYRLKGLHGHVLVAGAESGGLFWSHSDEPPIVTRDYSSSQFSGAAWSSPEKEGMVARYRQLIEQGGM